MKRAQPIPSLDELIEDISMTEKQRLFCIYYVKSFNATQSAIKPGYAADSAHVQGSVLLRNTKVAEEIRRVKGE
jgi:phage terminase small subunit